MQKTHKKDFTKQYSKWNQIEQKNAESINRTSDPIEKAILGTILLKPNLIEEIDSRPYMFNTYRLVADEIFSHYDETGEVDANILAVNCSKKGICSQSEIYSLVANASPSSLSKYNESLKTEWIRRNEIQLHQDALSKIMGGDDPVDIVLHTESERQMMMGFDKDEDETRVQQCNNFLDKIEDNRKNEKPSGYSCDFVSLDKLAGRFGVENRYRIFAARPAMGKSTLGLSIARNVAKNGCPSAVFILEMIFDQCAEKYAQQDTGISREDMQNGKVTDGEMDKIRRSIEGLYDLPLYIQDKEREANKIISKMRVLKRKHGVKFFAIDYIGLVEDFSKNYGIAKHQKISDISRKLSEFAAKEKVDVVAFCQLSRSVETRGGDKVPMLSDLRDSGSLEQDAGQIFFIYRPEYYGILEDQEGENLKGLTRIIKAKDRYIGKLNSSFLRYRETHDSFYDAGYGKQDNKGDDFVESVNKEDFYNPMISKRMKTGDGDIPF